MGDLEYCFKETMKLLSEAMEREDKLRAENKELKQYKRLDDVLYKKAKHWFIQHSKLNPYL